MADLALTISTSSEGMFYQLESAFLFW